VGAVGDVIAASVVRCYRRLMQRSRVTSPLVMCLALASVGCQQTNPAFNPDGGGDGSEGDGDSTTTQTDTTQSTTQSSGDGDGDGDGGDGEGGDGDGDTMDGPDGGMEAPVEDLPMEMCEVETYEGLWPHFGGPEQFLNNTCPPGFSGIVKVAGSVGSDWLVSHCPGGCSAACDLQTQWQFGAENLDTGPATLFPGNGLDPNQPFIGCYWIEVAENVKVTESACYYASISVHTHEGPESPLLFNANREGYGLTPGADVQYGSWEPPIIDQAAPTCQCDELEIECCPGSTVIAKQFQLQIPVLPPNGTGQVHINQNEFTFFGAQAQSGTTCDDTPDVSWALWDNQP
jgi:hypothetical protein